MSNDVSCLNTETRRHEDAMFFSVECVSQLCGGASNSPAAKRPASQDDTGTNTRPAGFLRVLYSVPVSSREAPSARIRCAARASVLRFLLFLLVVVFASDATAQTAKPSGPLRIGVTLHPYYSWTANVVGNLPGYEVRALLPGDIDAGDYQPRPQDIKRLTDLDVDHREWHRP